MLAELAERRNHLRSLEQEQKIKHREKNIFQLQATLYNEFPDNIKNKNLNCVTKMAKRHYKDQCLARALTIQNPFSPLRPSAIYLFLHFIFYSIYLY